MCKYDMSFVFEIFKQERDSKELKKIPEDFFDRGSTPPSFDKIVNKIFEMRQDKIIANSLVHSMNNEMIPFEMRFKKDFEELVNLHRKKIMGSVDAFYLESLRRFS